MFYIYEINHLWICDESNEFFVCLYQIYKHLLKSFWLEINLKLIWNWAEMFIENEALIHKNMKIQFTDEGLFLSHSVGVSEIEKL